MRCSCMCAEGTMKRVHLCCDAGRLCRYLRTVSLCGRANVCAVCRRETMGLCLSASYFPLCGLTHSCTATLTHAHTHTHLPLLASVKFQQFKDSKTGTIWSSLPASRFLPLPPMTSEGRQTAGWMKREEQRWRLRGGGGGGDGGRGVEMNRRGRQGDRDRGMRGSGVCVCCVWVSVCVRHSEQKVCREDVAWGYGKTVLLWWAGVDCSHPNHRHFI